MKLSLLRMAAVQSKSIPSFYKFPPKVELATLPAGMSFKEWINRFLFRMDGYNQLGLYRDDILYNRPEVLEALRRLPRPIVQQRDYRLMRAVQCDIKNIILPEKLWTTYEDNLENGYYLIKIVEEVEQEWQEREEWEATH